MSTKSLSTMPMSTRPMSTRPMSTTAAPEVDIPVTSPSPPSPSTKSFNWSRRRKIQYFPSLPMKFLTFRRKSNRYNYHTAVFAVLPRMTKHEISEYLVSCYSLPKPFKVNTAVMHAKGRRVSGKREVVSIKGREWKKAFVMWKEEDVMPTFEGEVTEDGKDL